MLYPKSVRCIIQLPFRCCEGCGIGIVIVYKNFFVVVWLNFGGGRHFVTCVRVIITDMSSKNTANDSAFNELENYN